MTSIAWYFGAAVCEIAGCYAFWSWLRLGRSAWWTLPGALSLLLFALALTRVDLDAATAGRAYAAYGGVYIVSSLIWLWMVEGVTPDVQDLAGCGVCLAGMAILLWGRIS